MKCHCKYCSPRFFCQTITNNDFCYYRYPIKINGTNDFGCVQADVARFICNTTDANYRTECCSSFFCNIHYQLSTSTNKFLTNENSNGLNIIIVISTMIIFGLLASIFYYVYKRKSIKNDDEIDFPSHTKKTSSILYSIEQHSDTISWNCDLSDQHDKFVPLETRRMNKEIIFLGLLGQGRHARVHLGLIGQQYRAIKMYETRFQNEFERERAIFQTNLIQHPNILTFFGADFFAKGTETCHMLIFEWHPRGTLYDVLKDNRNEQYLSIEKLFQYAISLSDAIAYLHAMKYGTNDVCKPQMAHCDIKSSNILVKLNGDCCLSDFSLAVRCNPHTNEIQGGGIERLYHRVGTKLYMPPELLNRNPSFHFNRINAYQQGDMYSLALVLWEIGNCVCSLRHIRPYENQLPMNFTVDQLIELVCIEGKRPISDENSSEKILQSYFQLLDFYWCQDPCARQSAANFQDQLRQLRPILV